MIPKIIHYCWLSDDQIPENILSYMNSWKVHLPEYQFIKWDFSRFPKDQCEWVKEAFEDKKYAFAADYIRLYAIYHYGGIYMDMDIEVKQPFGTLLDRPYMFGYERTEGKGFEAGCFGAEKGDKFIGACLQHYTDRHFIVNGMRDTTTLPQIMQKTYNEGKFEYKVLPNEYLTAKSYDTGIITITKNTRTIHHFAGSWIPEKQRVYAEKIQGIRAKYKNKAVTQLVSAPYRLFLAVDKRGLWGEVKYLLGKGKTSAPK